MTSGLNFLTWNPASVAFNEGQARTEQRRAQDLQMRRGEFDLGEAQRQSTQEQGIDTAIRTGMRPAPASPPPAALPPGPVDQVRGSGAQRVESAPLPPPTAAAPQAPAPQAGAPQPQMDQRSRVSTGVADSLAQTPGGGRMALQLRQQDERQRDADETNVMHYLSNPSTAHIGMQLAQRIGMNIPQQLAGNTAFWQGTAISKQLYPDDPGAAQKFVTAFIQGGGDIQAGTQAGMQAAGVPPKRRQYGVVQGDDGPVFYDVKDPRHQISGPARTTGQFLTGEDGSMQFLRQGRTQAEPITDASNAPLRAQRFGARGGQASVFQQKQQAWLAAHPGDAQGALAYASGTKQVDPATELRIASGIAKVELGNAPDPVVSSPAQRDAYQRSLQARAQEIVQSWRVNPQGGGVVPQSGAPQPQSDAAPQAPVMPQIPAAPAMPTATGTRENPAMPQSDDEYNALPSGAVFIDPDDGLQYTKP